jgi:hypothetical protein
MMRFACTLCGVVLFAVGGYFLIYLFTNWYGPRYVESDEDISNIYLLSLFALTLFAIFGGVLADWLYRKGVIVR